VGVVEGAPIPVKFRIEANTVAAIIETNRVGPRIIPVGRVGFITTAVFDLKGTIITATCGGVSEAIVVRITEPN
jgi:hypothetical protein